MLHRPSQRPRRRRSQPAPRRAVIAALTAILALLGPPASAQDGSGGGVSVMALFAQSFDVFTVLIVIGSIISIAIVVRCVILIRRSAVLPTESTDTVRSLILERRWPDLQQFVGADEGFLGRVLHEVLPKLRLNPLGIHEATEMAAETETARRFRDVEWLGVLGALGPLLGLVGTVWGMIIAFTAIGETGGQAAASQLSIGIAKALFHTFLGLTMAIPSLLAYGFFRERLDRLCVEGTMLATDSIDAIAHAGASAAPARPGQPGA